MDNKHLTLNANLIVAALQKPAAEFTKADIIDYIVKNDIRMVNFMYPGGDGKLKTLNFVINDLDYLETILTCGERVDGSSLFNFIQAGSSDLYVLPRFRTAFVDPFAEIPTVSLLCSYFDKDGNPLESSPEFTLHKAAEAFREVTGMEYQAMGEPRPTSSVPSVCSISLRLADRSNTVTLRWATSPSTARTTSRMRSNSCLYLWSRLPTS